MSSESDFILECSEQNIERVKFYLNRDDIFLSGDDYYNAILEVCENGNDELMDILLENNKYFSDELFMDDILIEACNNGYINIVKKILSLPYLRISQYCGSLFLEPCKKGYFEIVKLLVENDKTSSLVNSECIYEVCSEGHIEILNLLLDKNIKDFGDISYLEVAALNNHIEIIRRLLDDRKMKFEYSSSILEQASIGGNIEIIDFISEYYKINFTDIGDRLLSLAASRNRYDVVEYIILRSPSICGDNPICEAIENCNINMVNFLANSVKFDINNIIKTIFFVEDIEVYKNLINIFNINFSEDELLLNSLKFGSDNVIEYIIKKSENINIDSSYFINLCEKNYVSSIKIIINYKNIYPSAQDNLALIKACNNGSVTVVKLLLNNKKFVYSNSSFEDAIKISSKLRNRRIVKMLEKRRLKYLMNIFKNSVLLFIMYKKFIKKRYHPDSLAVKQLEEDFKNYIKD